MSFELDLKRFADKTGLKVDTVIKKVSLEVLSSVVEKSPVDSGRFRSNWNLALGHKDKKTTDRTENDAVGRGESVLLNYSSGSINITNALPYASRLENGYSGQAPSGVVGITVVEFKQMFKKALREIK